MPTAWAIRPYTQYLHSKQREILAYAARKSEGSAHCRVLEYPGSRAITVGVVQRSPITNGRRGRWKAMCRFHYRLSPALRQTWQ